MDKQFPSHYKNLSEFPSHTRKLMAVGNLFVRPVDMDGLLFGVPGAEDKVASRYYIFRLTEPGKPKNLLSNHVIAVCDHKQTSVTGDLSLPAPGDFWYLREYRELAILGEAALMQSFAMGLSAMFVEQFYRLVNRAKS